MVGMGAVVSNPTRACKERFMAVDVRNSTHKKRTRAGAGVPFAATETEASSQCLLHPIEHECMDLCFGWADNRKIVDESTVSGSVLTIPLACGRF